MSGMQRTVIALALVALLAASWNAPYDYEGYTYFGMSMPTSGVLHAPLWAAPEAKPAFPYKLDHDTYVTAARLDVGKLAIWWGAIALLTVAAVALSAPRRTSAER